MLEYRTMGGRRPIEADFPAWALQATAGVGSDIAVFVPPEDKFLKVFVHVLQEMKTRRPGRRSIQLVDRTANHEIAVSATRCRIKIRTHTYLRGKYAVQEIKSYGRV